jgi:hypothetical protein
MTATLLAESAVTLLNVALQEWLDADDDRSLSEIIRTGLHSLQTAFATLSPELTQTPGPSDRS